MTPEEKQSGIPSVLIGTDGNIYALLPGAGAVTTPRSASDGSAYLARFEMNHIQPGSISDPFAFFITDQHHPLTLIFRNIDHAFFTRQVGGNLGKRIRLAHFSLMLGYGSRWAFFRLCG